MKTNSIKVSIILPSLNVAKYIKQCINSVADQTLDEIEIICVDAMSTDGTREIISEYAQNDSKIRIVDSNLKSYGRQMNLGLDAANGEYIGIVETDDFVDSDAFKALYAIAKKNDADIVKANYFEYRDNLGNKVFDNSLGIKHNIPFSVEDYPEILLQSKSIWSGIYKKEFLACNGIRFNETLGASYQDIDFFDKTCLCAKRIVLTDKAYLHYRMDNASSSINSKDKMYAVCNEHEDVKEFITKNGIKMPEEVTDAFIASKVNDYLWNYLRIAREDREEFAVRMKDDFINIPKDRISRNRFLSGLIKNDMKRLLDSPEKYSTYRETSTSRLLHCIDDNGLLYTLKYAITKKLK